MSWEGRVCPSLPWLKTAHMSVQAHDRYDGLSVGFLICLSRLSLIAWKQPRRLDGPCPGWLFVKVVYSSHWRKRWLKSGTSLLHAAQNTILNELARRLLQRVQLHLRARALTRGSNELRLFILFIRVHVSCFSKSKTVI